MEGYISPAAQVVISVIPLAGILFASSIVFFALLWKHRENMLRIEKGNYEPPKIDLRGFALLLGLCLTATGLVLSAMFALLEHLSWGLLGGLLPLAVGLSLLVYYQLSKRP